MGLGSLMNSLTRAGEVNGSEFPFGTFINFGSDEGENFMLFTYPNKTEERITHDMIKCATILSMGVIDINTQKSSGLRTMTGVVMGGVTMIYGTKYLCVLKDGRQAVLTVPLGNNQYRVESILF